MAVKAWFIVCAVGLSTTFLLTLFSNYRKKTRKSQKSVKKYTEKGKCKVVAKESKVVAKERKVVAKEKKLQLNDPLISDCHNRLIDRQMVVIDQENVLNFDQAKLVSLLISGNNSPETKKKALITITNKAAFSANQIVFRQVGCLRRLATLIHSYDVLMRSERSFFNSDAAVLQSALLAINNLAMNGDNQKYFQCIIPTLKNFAINAKTSDDIRLSSLKVLINLSVMPVFHPLYKQLVPNLFIWAGDDANATLQLASVRLLVNLSCNKNMAIDLLSAKLPKTISNFEVPFESTDDVKLRWLNILANILRAIAENSIENISKCKRDSHEPILQDMIFNPDKVATLRKKLSRLSAEEDSESDIYQLAAVILNFLVAV